MSDNNCKQCGIGTSGYGYDGLYDGFCPDCISKQRDALLAACEAYVYGDKDDRECEAMMKAAIANAKGGA